MPSRFCKHNIRIGGRTCLPVCAVGLILDWEERRTVWGSEGMPHHDLCHSIFNNRQMLNPSNRWLLTWCITLLHKSHPSSPSIANCCPLPGPMLHSCSSPSCLDDAVSTLLLSPSSAGSHPIVSNNKMTVPVSNNKMMDGTSLQWWEDGTPSLSPRHGNKQSTHYLCHITTTMCAATSLFSSLFLPCHSDEQGTHHLPLSPCHNNDCPPTLHIHLFFLFLFLFF